MKKNVLLITFMAMIVAILCTACSQEDEAVYSCDKAVNAWAVSHINDIQVMTRAQWEKLDFDKGKAAFKAFTLDQKKNFWEKKISDVLLLNWKEAERIHIQKLLHFIRSNSYLYASKELSNEDNDRIELFFYNWSKFGKEQLGWNDKIIYAIAVSGYSVLDRNGSIKEPQPKKDEIAMSRSRQAAGSLKSIPSKCHCNTSFILSCFPAGPACEASSCSSSSGGCGFALMQACNGSCGGDMNSQKNGIPKV